MSCEIVTSNSKYFCDTIESVSQVLRLGYLSVRDDGLYVSGMDEMHVSLIKLEIEKDDFDTFTKTGSVNIGLNFEEFVKILKTSSGNGILLLKYNESNPKLQIVFNNDGLKRKYSIMLIDIDIDDIEVPCIDYHLELKLCTKLFTNIIQSVIATEAEEITFQIRDKKLLALSKGDISETEFTFDKKEGFSNKTNLKLSLKKKSSDKVVNKKKLYELLSCEGNFSVTVGISLLKNIIKANNLTDYVTLNMIANNPIRLDYNLNEDGSFIYYYVSPKLEDY